MLDIFFRITPILLMFCIGLLLRALKIFNARQGHELIKMVFHVALPAFIINVFSNATIEVSFVYITLSAFIVIMLMYVFASLLGRAYKLPGKQLGVVLLGSMVLNIGFVLPFVYAGFGDEGIARLSMFDLGNGLMTFTLTYALACKHGTGGHKGLPWKRFFSAPPVWALFTGISINLSGIELHSTLAGLVEQLAAVAIPLMMLSLGIFFTPKALNLRVILSVVSLRMVGGLLIGLLLTWVFQLSGLTRTIVLMGAMAPVGFNTLTFSNAEGLDTEWAASLVSVGIVAGMVVFPIVTMVWGS